MEPGGKLVGVSLAIRTVLEDAEAVAATDCNVLITGERGVGKKVLARMIHRHSRRAHLPVVTIKCAGVAEEVVEAELFGHMRSSGVGRHGHGNGVIDGPDWGTALLHEIGEMSLQMQSLLLRLIGNGDSEGGGAKRRESMVDRRVIALSSRNLFQQIRRHEFNADLYYRLNVVHLMIPPLRERRQDIPVLFDRFLSTLSKQHGVPVCEVTPEAMIALTQHDWPGNVRELKAVAQRILLMHSGRIVTPADLPLEG